MISSVPDVAPSPKINDREEQALLNFRLVRGNLPLSSSRIILDEYNRQTSSRIPFREFIHWTQNSPAGPALHGILETQDDQIVGHHCLLPIPARFGEKQLVVAKSEYTFLNEEYRTAKILGHEKSRQLTHLIASRLLLEHGDAIGWSPILISTLPFLFRLARTVGTTALQVPVYECLLVLKPVDAAKRTLNLLHWQRAVLGMTGVAQSLVWKPTLSLSEKSKSLQTFPIDRECASRKSEDVLTFFQDRETLRWRYFNDQYQKVAVDTNPQDYVIIKSGSEDGYVRVCQWNLSADEPGLALLFGLIRLAEQKNALGLRWAVYGTDENARKMVSRMRRLGFLCARRTRTMLIRTKESRFLEAANWDLNDAMFSFHH